MTISTTENRKEYACNGVTTEFSFPYYFLADEDLVVLLVTVADGTEATLELGTDYTVSGAGEASGGTVTTTSAYASTYELVVYRDPALTQGTDLVENDPLPANELEKAYDRLTMINQRDREILGRSLRLPEGDTGFTAGQLLLPAKVLRAGQLLGFDGDGAPVAAEASETVLPTTASTYIKRNAGNTAFDAKAPSEVLTDLQAARHDDLFSDWVISGLLPATSADLTSDISAGAAYVTGRRLTQTATSHTYTASVDTYVDLDSTGTYLFAEVATGAAAPAQPADSIRLAKVVTDASAITSVTDLREAVQRLKNYPRVVTPEMFGAVGDGVADDTLAIENMFAAERNIRIPAKTYLIDPTLHALNGDPYGVRVRSDTTVMFERGAILQAKTNDATNYAVLGVFSASGVLIYGKGKILGDRATHTGTTGEHGHGLDIRNSSRVYVRDLESNNCWGDGIYVGHHSTSGTNCTEVHLYGVRAENNRRDNCSITALDRGSVIACMFVNANGTAPQAGINFEPNTDFTTKNITMSACVCEGNGNEGVLMAGGGGEVARITVSGNHLIANGSHGVRLISADLCVIAENHVASNGVDGIHLNPARYIAVRGNVVRKNTTGIHLVSSDYCSVDGNISGLNGHYGIRLDTGSKNNIVAGNHVFENSQTTDAARDNISLSENVDYNNVQNNICRVGAQTNRPRYGIRIDTADCDSNLVTNNDLLNSGATGSLSDAGTGTVTAAGNRV